VLAGQEVTQTLLFRYLKALVESHDVQFEASPSQFNQCALTLSQASHVKLTVFPKKVPGQVSVQVPARRNSNPTNPHLVHIVLSRADHAPHSGAQSSQVLIVAL